MPARRFVLLQHDWDGTHYDLMLEEAGVLKTWRLSLPLTDQPQDATALSAHRLLYLDYEGPISGNRGVVRRVARGTYRPLDEQGRRYSLEGDDWQGTLHFDTVQGRCRVWMESQPSQAARHVSPCGAG